uniref:Calponin-homology (CH) domain-containing protein n=1 Tax=Anopheles melas TaxID=34690 RepID=A0A182TF87_9DIPT
MLGRCVSGQGSSDDLSVTKNLSQIYTDWANYYLERAKSKKKVSDLSADCRDGLLLAEVIEAVTTFKVPDLVKKPKTAQHMVSTRLQHLGWGFEFLTEAKRRTNLNSGRYTLFLDILEIFNAKPELVASDTKLFPSFPITKQGSNYS